MKQQTIAVLDFGGQRNQLMARRVRDLGVYCLVRPGNTSAREIAEMSPAGIILMGGSETFDQSSAPSVDADLFSLGVPVLAVGYCALLMNHQLGGDALHPITAATKLDPRKNALLAGVRGGAIIPGVCASALRLPEGFETIATAGDCKEAAFCHPGRNLYGLQFHPEYVGTEDGDRLLSNFLKNICRCEATWKVEDAIEDMIREIRLQVGDRRVLCALSGGVDSSVCAVLVNRAVGKQLTCMFVDTGLMRKNEGSEVAQAFRNQFDINFEYVDAEQRFLTRLAGVVSPEQKRKIIGEEFIRVFESEGAKLGKFGCLVQGTIYPDIIESGVGGAAVVKSHHNVGGLPDVIDFEELVEPLKYLFKDEVRRLGIALGLPEHLAWRQPFPGPGLGIRVIGEVTKQKLDTLREADAIFRAEIAAAGLDRKLSQYFAVITDLRSVGVQRDARTYEYTLALRAVHTTDFMTAEWARIPYELLDTVSQRIVKEVPGINRVVYDITGKPPATIEWE